MSKRFCDLTGRRRLVAVYGNNDLADAPIGLYACAVQPATCGRMFYRFLRKDRQRPLPVHRTNNEERWYHTDEWGDIRSPRSEQRIPETWILTATALEAKPE